MKDFNEITVNEITVVEAPLGWPAQEHLNRLTKVFG